VAFGKSMSLKTIDLETSDPDRSHHPSPVTLLLSHVSALLDIGRADATIASNTPNISVQYQNLQKTRVRLITAIARYGRQIQQAVSAAVRTLQSHFFHLFRDQEPPERRYTANPDFIRPDSRRKLLFKLVVQFFVRGLRSFSISRATIDSTVSLPTAPNPVLYTWFDALLSSLSITLYLLCKDAVLVLVCVSNKLVDEQAPGAFLQRGTPTAIERVLYTILESVQLPTDLLSPTISKVGSAVYQQLRDFAGFRNRDVGTVCCCFSSCYLGSTAKLPGSRQVNLLFNAF
jgi:hypothetical protein